MKLRTKATLFFGVVLISGLFSILFFIQYIVGIVFKNQVAASFEGVVEQSESVYFAMREGIKAQVLDWTSDSSVKTISTRILATPAETQERTLLQKEFAAYLNSQKIPFDKSIFLVDLLDHEGIVVASTDIKRIGVNAQKEEFMRKSHNFTRAINSKFGEVFIESAVFGETASSLPISYATTRIIEQDKNGEYKLIDGVLSLHFSKMLEVSNALRGDNNVIEEGRITKGGFISRYRTSDIYIVNREHFLVTQMRGIKDIGVRQKIETIPVQECFDNGVETNQEYDNYQGVRVFGVAHCIKEDGLVLIAEISADEVYAPLALLMHRIIIGGVVMFILGILFITLFVRRPLKHINEVIAVAEEVSSGNLEVKVKVRTNDEIGYLATVFNDMISAIRKSKKNLEIAKNDIEGKMVTLIEQEKFIENSNKATRNLLEDVWQAKEKLEVEERRLQTILASIGDALILIDGEYNITLVNQKASDIFMLPKEDIVGKDIRTVMKLWKHKKTEIPFTEWPIEEMFLMKKSVITDLEDGFSLTTEKREKQLPIGLSAAPLGAGLSGGVIIIRDITKDSELDEAKSGFISIASHQLRTPLTSIRWYSESLNDGSMGPLNEMQADFMKEIYQGSLRLFRTIDTLLALSRVDSGKFEVHPVILDVKVFTEGTIKEIEPLLREKNITPHINAEDSLPDIFVDAFMLKEVLTNLFANSIRYTNDGGLIDIDLKSEGANVICSVRDNGIGIPEEQQAKIFGRFFRADNALSKVPDGSGLGLSLVKELVEKWGGKIWFESKEGEGSTFFVTIPIAKNDTTA